LRRWTLDQLLMTIDPATSHRVEAVWITRCELGDQGALECACSSGGGKALAKSGVAFEVEVSRVHVGSALPAGNVVLSVATRGCNVPAGPVDGSPCAATEVRASSRTTTLLRFVPLLGQLPMVALTTGGAIQMPPVDVNETAWGGYVMGAILSPSVAETTPALDTEQAVVAPLRESVLLVPRSALRDSAMRLKCNIDCSSLLQRAVQSGHTVIWVDGDLPLASALTLGNDERPVLLWVEGEVRLGPRVSLTGLLMAGSVAWEASEEGESHVRGAIVADGPITVTGSPAIEWAPQVLDRLAASAGWFEPVPVGRRVN